MRLNSVDTPLTIHGKIGHLNSAFLCMDRGCTPVPGYTLFVGKDISGYDIVKISSIADGAAKCSADPGCNSFNYYLPGNEGYTKTVAYTSAGAVASASICYYAKDRLDSSACGAIAEQYGLRPKTGTGGTLPADVQKLWTSHACDAKVCMYLVDKYKIIEGVSWGALPEDWKAAWIAIPCSPGPAQRCAPSAGYLVTPNEDHTGDDISQAAAGTAAATCTANAKCLGFNLAGWLKTSNALTEPTANTCYYQKLSDSILDAVGCGALMEQYSIRPNYSWGFVTGAAMTAWSANNCDHKSCFYLDQKYGSAIPDLYKPSFASLGCAARVNASTCAKVSGYVATEGVDRKAPADELGYYPTNASATCTSNAKCQAFTGDGWLKAALKPNIARAGACWYAKIVVANVTLVSQTYTASYSNVVIETDASGKPTQAAVSAFVQSLKTNITNTWGVNATNVNITSLIINGVDVTSMVTTTTTGRRRSLFLGYAIPTRPNDYFIDFDELSVIGGTLNYNGFNFGPGFQLFGTQGFSNTPASSSIIPDDSHDIDTQNPVVLGVPDDGCITVPAGFTGIDMWVNFACDSGKCVAGATPACHVCDVKGDGSVNNVIRAYNVENCPLDAATGDARIVADWTYSRTPAGIIGGVSQGKGWNYWKWQNVKQSSSQTIKSIRFINRNVHRPRAATYDSEKWWLMIVSPPPPAVSPPPPAAASVSVSVTFNVLVDPAVTAPDASKLASATGATVTAACTKSANYVWDESKNPLGANRCVFGGAACECDGLRTCASSGFCSGESRPKPPAAPAVAAAAAKPAATVSSPAKPTAAISSSPAAKAAPAVTAAAAKPAASGSSPRRDAMLLMDWTCKCNKWSISIGPKTCIALDICRTIPCGAAPNKCIRNATKPLGYYCECGAGFTEKVVNGITRCYGNVARGAIAYANSVMNTWYPNLAIDGNRNTFFGSENNNGKYPGQLGLDLRVPHYIDGFKIVLRQDGAADWHKGMRLQVSDAPSRSWVSYGSTVWTQVTTFAYSRPNKDLGPADGTPSTFTPVNPSWVLNAVQIAELELYGYSLGDVNNLAALPWCSYSPCGGGTCFPSAPSGYWCKCSDYNYKINEGTLLETCVRVKDPCANNPCGNGFKCTRSKSYPDEYSW
ncbi:hypothetical protein GPECTOR_4g756 [Gonium pectorale]|uniref:Uncharacterized protein n=1 Tax=Gonium pectorale TaxID=33097 RepID=A0A150GYC8_GONPE|nr:hypothetical protein GPECTOR_4g756 [Gonium pectorale]|eukprot:KXZ54688.1 hypothetical protein GPECTOR_4g756 [Gonium pectorale]